MREKRKSAQFVYLKLLNCLSLCYDLFFLTISFKMTWLGMYVSILMWVPDVCSTVNLYLYSKQKSELKYSGVAFQFRMMLSTLLSILPESVIVEEDSWYLNLFVDN